MNKPLWIISYPLFAILKTKPHKHYQMDFWFSKAFTITANLNWQRSHQTASSGGSEEGPGGASAPVTTSLTPLAAPLNAESEIIISELIFAIMFFSFLHPLLDSGKVEH